MDNVHKFTSQLTELINNCSLPLSVVSVCLQNALFQIDIYKLTAELDTLKKEQQNTTDEQAELR